MSKLTEAVAEIVAQAQVAFTVSEGADDIKQSSQAIRGLLKEWQARDRMVVQTLRGLLDMVQANCRHEGAQRGYNDRDGSWMNPCPTCGRSE